MTAEEFEKASKSYFAENYEIVAEYRFVAPRPIRLNDHDPNDKAARRCRFCGRGEPEVSFRNVAHAVPEFLDNKSIRSMNECDACNEFLATNYEDHLSKWSLFARSLSQVKGKEGQPTFKNPAQTMRVEGGDGGLNIKLTDPSVPTPAVKEGDSLELPNQALSPPYVPIRAGKALIKVACSVCPTSELPQCRRAIDWLMERNEMHVSPVLVLYAFTPGPISDAASRVVVLRRKAEHSGPYLWCVIQWTGHRFQFFVPGCPADDKLFGGGTTNISAWHYRIPEFGTEWPFGETKYGRLDWSGNEPIQSSARASLFVDRIVDSSPGTPKGGQ